MDSEPAFDVLAFAESLDGQENAGPMRARGRSKSAAEGYVPGQQHAMGYSEGTEAYDPSAGGMEEYDHNVTRGVLKPFGDDLEGMEGFEEYNPGDFGDLDDGYEKAPPPAFVTRNTPVNSALSDM